MKITLVFLFLCSSCLAAQIDNLPDGFFKSDLPATVQKKRLQSDVWLSYGNSNARLPEFFLYTITFEGRDYTPTFILGTHARGLIRYGLDSAFELRLHTGYGFERIETEEGNFFSGQGFTRLAPGFK